MQLEPLQETKLATIREHLITWFNASRRDLPWRRDYSPYRVWIAEVMLQQTQVKTVLPYYRRWMECFPDIESVALAPAEELLKCWEGLGYYARVKGIHEAAGILLEQFGGQFPRDYLQVLRLPGIGPYTAGAIMSLAFNADFPVVDGNVQRVLARLFNIPTGIGTAGDRRLMWDLAGKLLPRGRARDFNQALMELGALICTPRNPACGKCPVAGQCASLQANTVHERPVPRERKRMVPIEVAVGLLVAGDEIFVQKRPDKGLMAGLWEFPGGKVKPGEQPEKTLLREFREELEVDICCLDKIALIRHSYTTFRVALHAFFCQLAEPARKPELRAAVEARWVTRKQLDRLAFPAANRKLIGML